MKTKIDETQLTNHKVVSNDEWYAASAQLLAKEKEFTRLRDELNLLRRDLPWTKVEQDYVFEGPDGKVKLSELFGDKSQLIIYHAMWGDEDKDGCPGCSLIMDHVDAARQHFEHHDIAYASISHAPYEKFAWFQKRMGWTFPWLSSAGTSFSFDVDQSFRKEEYEKGPVRYNFKMQKLSSPEQPGISVFYKNAKGEIFRTYSSYERGLDMLIGAYNYIDLTPRGRDENSPMDWVSLHDEYKELSHAQG
ncbi:MAG: DUF899 domain-containing protein [Armatimonadetes bacterium]|nr:DUF899 domain-containing protein [Armatimonadota bacterium]